MLGISITDIFPRILYNIVPASECRPGNSSAGSQLAITVLPKPTTDKKCFEIPPKAVTLFPDLSECLVDI